MDNTKPPLTKREYFALQFALVITKAKCKQYLNGIISDIASSISIEARDLADELIEVLKVE